MRPQNDRRDRRPEPPPTYGRVPPNDLDAEAATLSACLLKREAVDEVAHILRPEHFYAEQNKLIYESIVGLAGEGKPVDAVQVAAWLRERDRLPQAGGAANIARIIDATPAISNVESHARIIVERYRVRRMIAECQRIQAEGYGDIGPSEGWLADAEAAVAAVNESTAIGQQPEHSSDVIKRAWKELVERLERGDPPGLSTGNNDLDNLLNYMRPGQLIIVAAPTHMGKSTLCRQIVSYVTGATGSMPTEDGFFIWSGEQPREEALECMQYQEARIPENKMRKKHLLNNDDWRELHRAAADLSNAHIIIDDQPAITPYEFRAKLRQARRILEQRFVIVNGEKRKVRLAGAFVDYLQLMSARDMVEKNANREREISAITKSLKGIAGSEKVPLLAASQLSRAPSKRPDSRPQLSDLRESGAIEQDADKVVFIHNPHALERMRTIREGDKIPQPEAEVAELIVAKARGGGTMGTVRTVFFPGYGRFEKYDGRPTGDDE